MTRIPRIRCNYCRRRIPASSVICPNCNRNPRAFYWRTSYTVFAAILILLVLGGLVTLVLNTLGSAAPQIAAFSATATATETRAPMTVIVVATREPATATTTAATATTQATRSLPTRTDSPTEPPTDPPTVTITATITRTRVPRLTSTATRTVTPIPITAPILQSPPNEEKFSPNEQIVFGFSSAYKLRSDEWFRLEVNYIDRSKATANWCGFTKDLSLPFPKAMFEEASPDVRQFLWHIDIVRARATATSDCNFPFEPLGARSEVWSFYWF